MKKQIGIVGTGPAALMAASVLAQEGYSVTCFEKKKGPAKKLLIAGVSGLNITHQAPLEEFHTFYRGDQEFIKKVIHQFTPSQWISFVNDLGVSTFLGTSRRYFVKGLKASTLLSKWLKRLKTAGVIFKYDHECVSFEASDSHRVKLVFASGAEAEFDHILFALGGASYEPHEIDLRWPSIFINKQIQFEPFNPSNCGYEVSWNAAFLAESEGCALKNCLLTTVNGSSKGDLMITNYGLEGSPVYAVGCLGAASLDLKPDLSVQEVSAKLSQNPKKLAPIRLVKKQLNLSEAAHSLLYHQLDPAMRDSLQSLQIAIKAFPITLTQPRPIQEAISSAGGLSIDELNENLSLKKFPQVFVAGEMLNWDAPTGGFLIQACVSQGYVAAKGMASSSCSFSSAK